MRYLQSKQKKEGFPSFLLIHMVGIVTTRFYFSNLPKSTNFLSNGIDICDLLMLMQ